MRNHDNDCQRRNTNKNRVWIAGTEGSLVGRVNKKSYTDDFDSIRYKFYDGKDNHCYAGLLTGIRQQFYYEVCFPYTVE